MLKTDRSKQPVEIETMRAMIKDRGKYLYQLAVACKDAYPDTWEETFRSALTKYGCANFLAKFNDVKTLDEFINRYLSDTTKKVFDSDLIEKDEKHLVIKAGYCPLMHAWVESGGSDEFVKLLCDIAMDGDRAMVNSIETLDFSLQKSLAFGDHQCEFLVKLKEAYNYEESK